MANYPDEANQTYLTRDHAETELEESPPWWLQLVILVGGLLTFLTLVFQHEFLF